MPSVECCSKVQAIHKNKKSLKNLLTMVGASDIVLFAVAKHDSTRNGEVSKWS